MLSYFLKTLTITVNLCPVSLDETVHVDLCHKVTMALISKQPWQEFLYVFVQIQWISSTLSTEYPLRMSIPAT